MSFRTVNLIVGVVLAAQAVAVIVLLSSVTPVLLPVTANIGEGIPITSVNLGVAAVVLLVFAAAWRVVRPGPIARFIEWSQVSGVVVFLLAQLSGITDIAALVALYALTAGSVLFLALHERSTPDAGRWSFSFGAAVAVASNRYGVFLINSVISPLRRPLKFFKIDDSSHTTPVKSFRSK